MPEKPSLGLISGACRGLSEGMSTGATVLTGSQRASRRALASRFTEKVSIVRTLACLGRYSRNPNPKKRVVKNQNYSLL